MQVSLTLLPAHGTLSSCSIASSTLNIRICAYCYCNLLCWVAILVRAGLFCLERKKSEWIWRKRGGGREGLGEGNGGEEELKIN